MDQCTKALDKANLMRAKAFLQNKLVDSAGAEISEKEAQRYMEMMREERN